VIRAAHHAKASSAGSIGAGGNSRGLLIAALVVIASLLLPALATADTLPTVAGEEASDVGVTTAKLSGDVNPNGTAGAGNTTWRLQWSPVGQEAWATAAEGTIEPPASEAANPVEVEALLGFSWELSPGATYEFRLQAENGAGLAQTATPYPTFTMDSVVEPALSVEPVTEVGYTTAKLVGQVDPEGGNVNPIGPEVFPIYWELQYSTDGSSWSTAGAGEISGAEADDTAPIEVQAEATGLQPDTAYQVRLRTYYGNFINFFRETYSAVLDPAFTTKAVAKPTVTLDPVATHGDTTATFTGEVDTNAPAPLDPLAEAAFRAEWHISCTPACPNLAPGGGAGTVEAAEGSKAISVDATGLEPNTPYEVTLEASNAGGASGDAKAFATDLVAPSINPGPGRSDGKGGYHLEAALNPRNSAISSCTFEYGPSAAYGQSIPCASKPGAVNKTVFVTAHVTGLTLGTTYHFRVTAANAAGPTTSADATFVPSGSCPNEARREEQESTFLPECRAYELVTSPYKQGFAVVQQSYSDDDAVAYTSTGSFADNAYGALYNQYVARRSETGWKSISMTPPGEQWVFWGPAGAQSGLSGDLRSALWLMRPRSEPGEREGDHPDHNALYLARPDGTFSLLAPNPGTRIARVFQTTPDLSHAVLGGEYGQPAPNLYDVSGGDQVLRPIGVDNSGTPLPGAGVGNADGLCSWGMSADGRVIFFGNGDAFAGCTKPRARVGGATTIDLAASQCTRGVGDPGGVCNADAPVNPVGFARDGSRAFFITTQQLVNSDTDATNDVYVCEIPAGTVAPELPVNKCPNLRQLTTGGADVENVVRGSEDGSHVYFIAHGVLAANHGANDETAVAGAHNLYVWQTDAEHPEGHTTFVARLINPGDVGDNSQSSTQLTPDGRYLLVNTRDQLVTSGAGADTDSAFDVYRYDAQTGDWLRLSTDATGSGGNAENNTLVSFYSAMTDDGHTVVFITPEALAPADSNSELDVYAWHEGQVSLISSDGHFSPNDSGAAGITASGTDIFFKTTRQVTAADGDTSPDVYTARVGGGFDLREPAPCEGEACKGPLATPPSSSAPGSAGAGGAGNVKEKPRKCPKGKRRVRGKAGKSRCVPKRSGSRHGKRHHGAGGNGGAHK
jgi:hypothetical protein